MAVQPANPSNGVGVVDSRTVLIGDSICLQSGTEEGAYLFSQQSLKPKAFLRHPKVNKIHNFHAAVWEIYVPFEYRNQKRHIEIVANIKQIEHDDLEADAELARLVKKDKQVGVPTDEATKKHASKLKRRIKDIRHKLDELDKQKGKLEHARKRVFKAMQNDHETNRKEQARQTGKALVYGDIVQLRHKYSNNFLAGSTVKTSVLEYNNLRVALQEHSDRLCFFRVMPKYKVRGAGDEVKAGDQIKLVSEKATGHYLSHSVQKFTRSSGAAKGEGLLNENDFEVALSAQERPWSIQIYSGQKDGISGSLRAGDVIRLQDREKDGFISSAAMINVDRQAVTDARQQRINSSEKSKSEYGFGFDAPPSTPAATTTTMMLPELFDFVHMPFLNTGKDDDGGLRQESMSYWQIYLHGQHEVGVPLTYEMQKVVLRHLVSGKYLAVDPKSTVHSPPHKSYTALLIDDHTDARAAFRMLNVSENSTYVVDKTYCRLQNIITGAYLHTSISQLDALDKHTYEQCQAKNDVDEDIFDEKSIVNFSSQFSFQDAFEISRVEDDVLDDFNIVFGAVPLLQLVADATSSESSKTLPSQIQIFGQDKAVAASTTDAAWNNHGRRLIAVGTQMLAMLATFLVDEEEDDDTADWGAAAYARQGLCQDLGVLDLIVDILSGSINNIDEHKLTPRMVKELGSGTEGDDLLWNVAFLALHNSAKGEETSTDRYLARHSKIFCLHSMYLKTHGSAELLIELYENNRDALDDLLEDEARLDWILSHLERTENKSLQEDFVDHDFYNFLSTLCVCKELAVQRAQNRIFNKIESLGEDLFKHGHFIKLKLENNKFNNIVVYRSGNSAPENLLDLFQLVPGTGKEPEQSVDESVSAMRTLDYYEATPDAETKFLFIVSNMRLCASLCEGHGRKQVALVNTSMPKPVLFKVVCTRGLPYDLRSAAADILHEVFLDTGGALTVLSSTTTTRVYSYEDHVVKPETGPRALDLPEYKELNAERIVYTDQLLFWLTRADGFAVVLQDFALEMRRLLAEEDEFEDYHKEHGKFVIVILRSLYFVVEAGHVRDWKQISEVVSMLIGSFLVFAEDLITDEAATSRDDETRDAVIAEALEYALKTLQLLTMHEKQVSMQNFFNDYTCLLRLRDNHPKTQQQQRSGKSGAVGGKLGELKHVPSLFSTDSASKPDWTKLYPTKERAVVGSYLKDHFRDMSLDARINLKKILDVSYENKTKLAIKYKMLDLRTTPRSLNGILLDIVTRGEPEESEEYQSNIVKEGMTLLDLRFSREVGLFRDSDDVRIINDSNSRECNKKVSSLLPQLQYLIEDTQLDEDEAKRVTPLVHSLIDAIQVEGEPLFTLQDIAFKRNALDIVLKTFDQTLDDDDLMGDVNPLQEALVACFKFIELQTRDHKQAQDRMFDEMPTLLQSKNTRPPAVTAALAIALQEVFRNPAFQMRVRNTHIEEICQVMFDRLEEKVYVAELLDLLRSITDGEDRGSDRGSAVTRNQSLIVSSLMKQEALVLDVLKKEAAVSKYQREELRALLTAEPTDRLYSQYRYHVSLVLLLAELGEGKNQFIESICKKIYSLEYLLQVLTNADYVSQLDTFYAYLRFLYSIYLSDNCVLGLQHPRPLDSDPRMWAMIQRCADEIALMKEAPLTKRLTDHLFEVVIPFLSAFLRSHYNPTLLQATADRDTNADTISEGSFGFGGGLEAFKELGAAEVKGKCEKAVVSIAIDIATMLFDNQTASTVWGKVQRRKAIGMIITILHDGDLNITASQQIMSFIKGKGAFATSGGLDLMSMGAQGLSNQMDAHLRSSSQSGTNSGTTTTTTIVGDADEPVVSETAFNVPTNANADANAHHRSSTSTLVQVVMQGAHDDNVLTEQYRRYVLTTWIMYSDMNQEFGHQCHLPKHNEKGEMRNDECFYLEVHDDGETILPCGGEFQRKIELFTKNSNGEAHDLGVQTLLRYLGFLQDILSDVGATDDDREIARKNCVETLNLLSAIMHQGKCEQFKGVRYWEHTRQEHVELVGEMTSLQTKMALVGATQHCISLLADDEEDVMKAALLFFMMLLDGGNEHVQDLVFEAFRRQDTSKSLVRIRDELNRGIAALRQLQHNTVTQYDGNGLMATGAFSGGATLTGTMTSENMKLLQNHFGSINSASGFSLASGSMSVMSGAEDEIDPDIQAARLLNKQEFEWVMDIVRAIQLIVEGGHHKNQDWLREQKGSLGQSVNFVAELCRALALVYMNIGEGEKWQREQWLELIDQLLDSITELCQGNVKNQREALDEQIIKMVNHIIAYDTMEEHTLGDLTDTKRAALTVLEAMLETNNDSAKDIAESLLAQLNLDELYLAMNRFYYIDFYLKNRPALARDHPEHDPHTSKHLEAGHEAYYILRRMEDLTGQRYQWEKRKEDEIEKMMSGGGSGGGGGGNSSGGGGGGGDSSNASNTNTTSTSAATTSTMTEQDAEEADERLEDVFDAWCDKYMRRVNNDKNIVDKEEKFATSVYGEFCREFLYELDTHGGRNLGHACDRFEWFQNRTHSIEFLRDGALQKVYFDAPKDKISKTVRSEILLKLNHTSQQDKLRAFVAEFGNVRVSLAYQARLRSNAITALIAEGTGPYWKWASLFLTYVINLVMLVAYTAPTNPDEAEPVSPAWFQTTIYVLGSIHVLLSVVIAGEHLINNLKFPPSASTTYHVMFVVCSFLGLFYHAYFFAFHTLHIVSDNDILQRAIESITRNGISLLSVTVLAMTVVYLFAVVAFLLFRRDYDEDDGHYCNSLLQCFVTTLTYGLTHGGGPREAFLPGNEAGFFEDGHFLGRVVFDLLFWVLIAVIIMNLVLGIIVDTFSQLRSERERNLDEINNYCFICGLPAFSFNEASGGFKNHHRCEHNMWDYVYYSMHLQSIPSIDFSYNEAYLYKHLVDEPSTAAFPIQRALGVKTTTNDASAKLDHLSGRMDRLEQLLRTRFEQMDQAAILNEQLKLQEQWKRENDSKV
eukprot:m.234491 g.234491  ORF g.234491 m.234491 type:complete len:2978 (-) comp33655_c0_seq5:398-9331(-)